MFREKCGNQLPVTADFCPKSGNVFDSHVIIIFIVFLIWHVTAPPFHIFNYILCKKIKNIQNT